MATAAKSIVLVGDQMQLAQPIQGAHPRDSGRSALDHLLEGHAVVPPARGIFLSKTWRMHPNLCSFISAAVYEGKLQSEMGCAKQRLVLKKNAHVALKTTGLSFFPVEHSGCRQKSNEEAQATRDILTSLLGQRVIGRNGRERAMTLDDVLVVAPYNMQVNLLRSILPDGTRVGTVDKFQGQEAEAVIVSMTTSGADARRIISSVMQPPQRGDQPQPIAQTLLREAKRKTRHANATTDVSVNGILWGCHGRSPDADPSSGPLRSRLW